MRHRPGLRLIGLLAVSAAAASPTAAHAADPTGVVALPTERLGLTVPASVARSDCMTTRLAGRPGTTTVPFTPTHSGALTFALAGAEAGDWDLALFDHRSGRRLGGSGAFGAQELVQTTVGAGRVLDVQACRLSGTASTAALTIAGVSLNAVKRAASDPIQSLVRISAPTLAARRALGALGLDLGEDTGRASITAVLGSPAEARLLAKAGFIFQTLVPDLAAQDRRDRAADRAYTVRMRAAGGSPLPSGRTEYRHLEDIQADLKKIVAEHPAIARAVTLPKKTFQGRDTSGVELSANVNATDDQKPVSFLMGEHHAREWPSAEINVEFAIYLAQSYGSDPEVTALLDRTRVVIVPVINSDGFVESRDTVLDPADLTGDPAGAPSLLEGAVFNGGMLAYRRKNCDGASPLPSTPCVLQYGIDPNRNYAFNWGGLGASSSFNSQSYRGAGPWSEPETQAVHEFSQVHDITTLVTMHNFASLVLRPPGTSAEGTAPDEVPLKALGDAMAADTGYTSQYGYQLYDTSGTTEDWNYGAAGTYGYTIEMGPASTDGGNFHIAYDRGVVEQWTGTGERAGRGLRAALLKAVAAATDAAGFATVAGRAPAGRTLRVTKTFQTSTSPVCTIASPIDLDLTDGSLTGCINPTDPILIDDRLQYTTRVPANGHFTWLITPSTRPFVHKKGINESWTLTCEDDSATIRETRTVTLWRGEQASFDLPCGGTLPPRSTASKVKDRLRPRSQITRKSLLATRKGLQLAGTAVDFAPAGLTPKLKRVTVAVARKAGRRCRFITAGGAFAKAADCRRARYLPAHGTATWTFLLRRRLPKGSYLARVRAVDAAGNHERTTRSRNIISFRVR